MSPPPYRVLLIEDQQLVREGLRLILQSEDDIIVVGEATTGAVGLQLHEQLVALNGVDLVVTDLGLPDLSGAEVVRRIKERHPATGVLALSVLSGATEIREVVEAGADGYLLKHSSAEELRDAVRIIAQGGGSVLSPPIARALMALQRERPLDHSELTITLSEREHQILSLLAGGATSKEIAQRLKLSIKTISNHRGRIITKLGTTNTASAVIVAYQQGLITPPDAR